MGTECLALDFQQRSSADGAGLQHVDLLYQGHVALWRDRGAAVARLALEQRARALPLGGGELLLKERVHPRAVVVGVHLPLAAAARHLVRVVQQVAAREHLVRVGVGVGVGVGVSVRDRVRVRVSSR